MVLQVVGTEHVGFWPRSTLGTLSEHDDLLADLLRSPNFHLSPGLTPTLSSHLGPEARGTSGVGLSPLGPSTLQPRWRAGSYLSTGLMPPPAANTNQVFMRAPAANWNNRLAGGRLMPDRPLPKV